MKPNRPVLGTGLIDGADYYVYTDKGAMVSSVAFDQNDSDGQVTG